MIRNPVLDEVRSSIHSKPIPWNGLVRANKVDENEIQFFESLGKLSVHERRVKVSEQSGEYAQLIAQLFQKDNRDDIVKYLILFIVEYGDEIPQFAQSLAAQSPVWTALGERSSRRDSQIAMLACVALSVLASAGVEAPQKTAIETLKYIVEQLLLNAKNDIHLKDLGAQLLARLVQHAQYRDLFQQFASKALPALGELVSTGPLQVQYTSLLVLWILSFDATEAKRFVTTEESLVKVIIDTCRQAIREKIVRVGVAVLANLLRFAYKQAVPVLIAEEALPAANLIAQRKWADEELVEDLKYLTETLTREFENMTTFEEYSSELQARTLRWSHVHTNKSFWIDNIDEFRSNHWQPLKQLVQLLLSSNSPTTLAVAAHDIAEIVRLAPDAAPVVAKQGGKTRLMELITNSNPEIRFEALKATQSMIAQIFA